MLARLLTKHNGNVMEPAPRPRYKISRSGDKGSVKLHVTSLDRSNPEVPTSMSIPAPGDGVPAFRRAGWTMAVRTGPALLALDCIGLLLLWPATMLLLAPHLPGLEGIAALVIYPAFGLASLYAMGLYRRDAGASLRRALGRVPIAATVLNCLKVRYFLHRRIFARRTATPIFAG